MPPRPVLSTIKPQVQHLPRTRAMRDVQELIEQDGQMPVWTHKLMEGLCLLTSFSPALRMSLLSIPVCAKLLLSMEHNGAVLVEHMFQWCT